MHRKPKELTIKLYSEIINVVQVVNAYSH